ncbi:hypothetical protein GOV09_04950, partial [Candidatus Woesearchaeota archaeon]|nr:hypothetical protein [Candidatus Woesearchaeota archaeon]
MKLKKLTEWIIITIIASVFGGFQWYFLETSMGFGGLLPSILLVIIVSAYTIYTVYRLFQYLTPSMKRSTKFEGAMILVGFLQLITLIIIGMGFIGNLMVDLSMLFWVLSPVFAITGVILVVRAQKFYKSEEYSQISSIRKIIFKIFRIVNVIAAVIVLALWMFV